MITGDAKETAISIAQKLSIDVQGSLSGSELNELDEYGLSTIVNSVSVFYRTSPQHKLKIVKARFNNIFAIFRRL